MKDGARVATTIDIFTKTLERPETSARIVLQNFLRTSRFIGSKDRRAIRDLFFTALKTSHPPSVSTPRLRVAYTLLTQEAKSLDSVRELYAQEPYGPKALSASEEEILRRTLANVNQHMRSAPTVMFPPWLEQDIRSALTTQQQEAFLERAPLDIRTNTLKISRDTLLSYLQNAGLDCAPTPLSSWGIRFAHHPSLQKHTLFTKGFFEPQDAGSQWTVLASRAQPHQKVLDLCAGAGGKTLALAAMMKNKGTLVASDISAERLRILQKRARRANVRCLHIIPPKKLYRSQMLFDLVFIDAPCSGAGRLRREPDILFRLTRSKLQELLFTQERLLEQGGSLVRPGGRLVYVTCSFFSCENEERALSFLRTHPSFERDTQSDVPRNLSPSSDGCDAFYITIFLKRF